MALKEVVHHFLLIFSMYFYWNYGLNFWGNFYKIKNRGILDWTKRARPIFVISNFIRDNNFFCKEHMYLIWQNWTYCNSMLLSGDPATEPKIIPSQALVGIQQGRGHSIFGQKKNSYYPQSWLLLRHYFAPKIHQWYKEKIVCKL